MPQASSGPSPSQDEKQTQDHASTDESRTQDYRDARTAFDSLRLEDRAFFLLDATASTLVHALEEAGTALGRELEAFFSRMEHAGEDEPQAEAPANPDDAETGDPKSTGKTAQASQKEKTTSKETPKASPKSKRSTTKKSSSAKSAGAGKKSDSSNAAASGPKKDAE